MPHALPSMTRAPSVRLPRAAALGLALPLMLAACSAPKQDNFAPPCPRPIILPDAGDLSRYQGAGRDPTSLVLQARITGLSGSCETGGRDITKVSVTVAMELARGPAAQGRDAQLAWFLSVMRGDQILDKQVYPLAIRFPDNAVRVSATAEPVVLNLPTPRGTTGADYQVVVGLQLSADELARNRRP